VAAHNIHAMAYEFQVTVDAAGPRTLADPEGNEFCLS
jgi:hypothetical protein